MTNLIVEERDYKILDNTSCLVYDVAYDSLNQEIHRYEIHKRKCALEKWIHICEMKLLDPYEIADHLCLHDIYSTCSINPNQMSRNKNVCLFENPNLIKEYCLCKDKGHIVNTNETLQCICHTTFSTKCIQRDQTIKSCDIFYRKTCLIHGIKNINDTLTINAKCILENCMFPFEHIYFNTSYLNDNKSFCNDYFIREDITQNLEDLSKFSALSLIRNSGMSILTTKEFLPLFLLLFYLFTYFGLITKIFIKQ